MGRLWRQAVELLRSLEAFRRRNAGRTGHRLSDESLVRNYSDYEWCVTRFPPPHVLDTTSMTEDTQHLVAQILDLEGPRITQRS